MKVKGALGKVPLRNLLYRYVPKQLVDRPKKGFGVPIYEWLRGPMRSWAEDLLDESRLKSEAYFDAKPIRQKWNEHVSGRRNWQAQLWAVLMFQAWLEQQKVHTAVESDFSPETVQIPNTSTAASAQPSAT
jgi:asparagine synthase (glutamine-hydrolysing)